MKHAEEQGPFCQSCAMPLHKPEDFGTEANGIHTNDYCAYCYVNGAFTLPNATMEEMRERCIDRMVDLHMMPRDHASLLMGQVIPKLARWSRR